MKKVLIAAVIALGLSGVSYLASKIAYRIGGLVMDGPESYYVRWSRITEFFEQCAFVLLVIGVILSVILLIMWIVRKK